LKTGAGIILIPYIVPLKKGPAFREVNGGRLKPGQVLVSSAATISLSRLETQIPRGVSVAPLMPKAPSLVDQRMNPFFMAGL